MAKVFRLLFVLLFATGIAFTGCESDDGNPAGPDGDGGGDITITVTTGLTPTYSWGGGDVNDLMVVRTSNNLIVWGVHGPNGTDPVASPVVHGEVPEGATKYSYEEDEDIPLVGGVEYKVSVTRSNGTEGWFTWTPQDQATTASISGTVKDAETGDPIDGARVSCSDGTTVTTADNGTYSMTVAAGSDRIFTASKTGYESSNDTRNITAGQSVTINFNLNPSSGGETQIPFGFYGTWQHRATVEDGELDVFPASTLFTIDQNGNWSYSTGTITIHSGTCTWEEYSSDIVTTIYKMVITYTESMDTTLINTSEEVFVEYWAGDNAYFRYPNSDMVDYLIMPDDDEARFAGFVINEGNFLEGVRVEGENTTVYAEWDDITDSDGFFFSYGDEAGNYSVEATKFDWEDWQNNFNCALGEVVFLVIEMFPSGGSNEGEARAWGRVWDDDTGLSIPDVIIYCDDGTMDTTDTNGHYSMLVNPGMRAFTAVKNGYEVGYAQQDMIENQEYEINYVLVPVSGGDGTGVIHGKVTDSQNGEPMAGVTISSDDYNSTETDENGDYSLQVDAGAREITASFVGYYPYSYTIYVVDEGDYERNFTLSPLLVSEGQLRFVLNWGELPSDLDSYLKTPDIEGADYTVYYGDEGSESLPPYATLDNDDQNGFGPETITIYNLYPGTYRYFVNKYSWDGDLPGCGAVVNIYDDSGLIHSLTVPETGEGDYWNVCEVDGVTGEISIINSLSDDEPELFGGLERPVKPQH